MKKWVVILIIAVFFTVATLVVWLVPILQWSDGIQTWEAILGIITGAGTIVGWIWALGERKKDRQSTSVKVKNGDYVNGDKKLEAGDGSLVADRIYAETVEVKNYFGHSEHSQEPHQQPDLAAAEKRYYQFLINRYQHLEFKGMGMTGKIPLNMPLMDLYVPLKARREMPDFEKAERRNAVKAMVGGREVLDEEGNPKQFSDTEPILGILQKHGSLVVLGDPGSGKSTLLKWLTLVMANQLAEEFGLAQRLPILLSLSSYAREMEEQGDCSLDKYLARRFKEQVSDDLPIEELYRQALATGQALVLLDGLDEVSNKQLRQTVVNRVQNYHALHCERGNQFILTSRIVGYKEVRLTGKDLQEATLVDFDDEEIETFIAKWTSVIERLAQEEEKLAKEAAERERTQLQDAIQRNPGVRRLAANPLLLTILCGMKRQGVTLPERRVQLYERYVQVLLEQWNQARNLDGTTPGRNINVVQTIRLLAPLALWMHQHSAGVGRVKVQELRRKMMELFEAQGEEQPEAATDHFLADVRDHSCLLVERGDGEYGFLHLTFEEYLAGVGIALAGQGNAETIAQQIGDRVDDDVWRESSLLAIAYVTLIQQLFDIAGNILIWLVEHQPGEKGKAVLLAGEALVDTGKDAIPAAARNKVVQALIPVMQTKDIMIQIRQRSGIALSSLGWAPQDLDWFLPVPAGQFLYGDEKETKEIPYDFWMAKYPVTNMQYRRFIEAGGYQNQEYWEKKGKQWLEQSERKVPHFWHTSQWNTALQPVVGVTWYEAEAYANWMHQVCLHQGLLTPEGKMDIPERYRVQLPQETEWEYAARGSDGREYPWGNEFIAEYANTEENELGITTTVNTYVDSASPFGILDLSGNVWEWQQNLHSNKEPYPVIRGGSWHFNQRFARCAFRLRFNPDSFNNIIGFRLILSPIERSL
jgi:formylglycine-generating enzyme required for sulfatase activity/energy-coupling factor transporter ATP-binding protein EcfA2